MDFGRTNNLEIVDFTLPPSHKSVEKILGDTKNIHPKIYVGGVLWSDESFKGTLYPERTQVKDYAKQYTKQFNTIELNLTHYRLPEKEKIQKWYEESPSDFKFCPKVHKDISHSSNLLNTIDYYEEFYQSVKHFQHKLGTCFLQLPPHFAPNRLNELLDFLDKSNLRNIAVELRHADWFKESVALNTLCNYLYKNNMALTITDTPTRRDVLHMRLTNKTAFIRFNANDKHPSDYIRINEWIQRIQQWLQLGLETIYFFIHTPTQINMPNLVIYFIQQLKKECGIILKQPKIRSESEQYYDKLF
jgi:uncharacterized protein YecE (DUF72 family)